MRLYHYCCSCSARRIGLRGFLQPNGAQLFGVALIWLTDQPIPDREGLGLTSRMLSCDRLERQYIADVRPEQVQRWMDSDVRRRLARDPEFHEFEDGRRPDTWWIATKPIYAARNRAYELAASAPARLTDSEPGKATGSAEKVQTSAHD